MKLTTSQVVCSALSSVFYISIWLRVVHAVPVTFTPDGYTFSDPDPGVPKRRMYAYFLVDKQSLRLYVGANQYFYFLPLVNVNSTNTISTQYYRSAKLGTEDCRNHPTQSPETCGHKVRLLHRQRNNRTSELEIFCCAGGEYTKHAEYFIFDYQGKLKRRVKLPSVSGASATQPDYDFAQYHDYCMAGAWKRYHNVSVLFVPESKLFYVSSGGEPGHIRVLRELNYRMPAEATPSSVVNTNLDNALLGTGLDYQHWDELGQHVTFVKTFDMKDYVLFFFHEEDWPRAYVHHEPRRLSRVGRVCKNDHGVTYTPERYYGKTAKRFATLLKAELVCRLADSADWESYSFGNQPLDFELIQDVYRVGDVFYAVFTTNLNQQSASALCAFHLKHIEDALFSNGTLLARVPFADRHFGRQFDYRLVAGSEIPSAVRNLRRSCPAKGLSYASKHLSYLTVNCTSGAKVYTLSSFLNKNAHAGQQLDQQYLAPYFYMAGEVFTHIAVDPFYETGSFAVFISTSRGIVHKVMLITRYQEGFNKMAAIHLASWELFPKQSLTYKNGEGHLVMQPVQAYELATVDERKYLYVGGMSSVWQIPVEQCEQYDREYCTRDLYCGWKEKEKQCVAYVTAKDSAELVQENRDAICNPSKLSKLEPGLVRVNVSLGQPFKLQCSHPCLVGAVSWRHWPEGEAKSGKPARVLHLPGILEAPSFGSAGSTVETPLSTAEETDFNSWKTGVFSRGRDGLELVVLRASRGHLGVVDCSTELSGGRGVVNWTRFELRARCDLRCRYEREFERWQRRFDSYQSSYLDWKRKVDDCSAR